MLRSDLCDNSDAYIFVKGTITVEGDDDDKTRNNVLFRSCISKINNTYLQTMQKILMFIVPMIRYSDNCSMTSGTLWNFCRDGINDNQN